jgi:hypothetical protein
LKFDPNVVEVFFRLLRDSYNGDIVCEPRHATWFNAEVDTFLTDRRVPGSRLTLSRTQMRGSPADGVGSCTIACTDRRRCTIRPTPTRNLPKPPGNSKSVRLREHGPGAFSIIRRSLLRRPTLSPLLCSFDDGWVPQAGASLSF